jgi:hypothetical protein
MISKRSKTSLCGAEIEGRWRAKEGACRISVNEAVFPTLVTHLTRMVIAVAIVFAHGGHVMMP